MTPQGLHQRAQEAVKGDDGTDLCQVRGRTFYIARHANNTKGASEHSCNSRGFNHA